MIARLNSNKRKCEKVKEKNSTAIKLINNYYSFQINKVKPKYLTIILFEYIQRTKPNAPKSCYQ